MKSMKRSAIVAAVLLASACASGPTGGTNPESGGGQTLGGYVATGAIDPNNTSDAHNPRNGDQPTSATPANGTPSSTDTTSTDNSAQPQKPPVG